MTDQTELTGFPQPDKETLLAAYRKLYQMHLHHLLPLETELPAELQPESRDKYRITMTMILSGGMSDNRLARSLGKLFKRHVSLASLNGMTKAQIRELLSQCGFGYTNPDGGGNGARLWSFLECYFGLWTQKLTEANVLTLYHKKGFGGGKFVRALQAYCYGNKAVLPADKPALSALRDPLFPQYLSSSDDAIRKDIETKLGSEAGIALIDFHEMLCFIEQYTGKSKRKQNEVVIGWNAWRLLCSTERERITRNWTWIHEHLVKDKDIAKELWDFYHEINRC